MTSTHTPTPLQTIILDLLRQSGPITFAHYMSLCLYHPQHGYYMQGRERTGVAGDYFTSPDLHPIFARLVARQAAEMWEILGRPAPFTWVEMGAGRGWLARDFLQWVVTKWPDFAAALDYVAIEPGPAPRARVAQRLREIGLQGRVRLLANFEELLPTGAGTGPDPTAVTGCFFSNELIDAFPVSVVTRANGRVKEIYVAAEGEAMRETTGPISDPAVAAAVAPYAKEIEEGQRVEVNLHAARWIKSVAEKLRQGFVLTIDYGDLAGRLYTPHRRRGTLMAYRGHTASEDFFGAPGEQDLTAHVNFSALIAAGKRSSLDCLGLTTQERFLMALGESTGFSDLYDPGQSPLQQLDARLKLKRLIHPEGMGTIFKVLIQYRGARDAPQPQLTGLKFQRTVACG
jgi:SAM-dependent MidA family methyltransferase